MTCHLPKFCPLSFDHRAILLMLLLNYSGITHGYPEFSGDGYFSCTSCHVSASGGDLVTAYGRSFSEEKIAAFHFVGEAQPFHGQATLPEWLLVGGHLRELQLNYEDERVKEGRHFRMQQEIDLGVNVKNIWTYATVSAERKEQNPYEFQPNRPLISKWIFRYDPLEAVSLRVGRIYPKFGLNVPDHNAFVRQNLDLGAGKERPLAEISYFSELAEVNLSHSAGFLPNTKLDEPEKNFPASQEIYLNISTFWYESQRISVSAVERKRGEALSRFVSGSAVITPLLGKDKTFRILLEHQYGLEVDKGMKSRMTNSYLKFWFHPIAGIFPYTLYERENRFGGIQEAFVDRIAFGTSFHPRPHLEFSGSLGTRRDLRKYRFGNTANFVFHYWL